ncbi:MAG: hypothetical protein ACI9H6_000303 [Patiriisocius sp.]|jgi:hypothetical protein
MKNPYENPENELSPTLKQAAQVIDNGIRKLIPEYDMYVFAQEIVTHLLDADQQQQLAPYLEDLTELCRLKGLVLTQTDVGLQLTLQKLDKTV